MDMRPLFLLIFALLFSPAVAGSEGIAAAPPEAREIWPEGKMPGHAIEAPETKARPERKDALRITNVSKPTLEIYPAPIGKAPAVIISPGGGYGYVVMDKEGSMVARWLNDQGFTALVLKYRVPDNREGALQDIRRAIRFARHHAGEFHIDPARLGVMGFSAGGHLAARAACPEDPSSYQAIDVIDNHSCRPDFAILVYPAYLAGRDGTIAPEVKPHAASPPTLIIHTEDDRAFVAGSKAYAAALLARGNPHRFLLYQTGGHGYGVSATGEAKAWPADALPWLKDR